LYNPNFHHSVAVTRLFLPIQSPIANLSPSPPEASALAIGHLPEVLPELDLICSGDKEFKDGESEVTEGLLVNEMLVDEAEVAAAV
jgi:hypothetical protein